MKTYKNFWATLLIAFLWGVLFIFLEIMQYTPLFGLMLLVAPLVACVITYQILRALQYIPDVLEKQESRRQTRRQMDSWLNNLDDAELDLLRQRLDDLEDREFASLGRLLAEEEGGKRKIR